jgi:C4-dicarboxylate-specific signal transduction histidine kinase
MPLPHMATFTSHRYWTIAPAICLGSIAAAVAALGYLLFVQLTTPLSQERDGAWAVFEMGFEHNRLLLAAEKGESLDYITLRGDIYLSRVKVVRDSRPIADVRQRMPEEQLSRLYESAAETGRLIDGLDSGAGLDALLVHLRADAKLIREVMLEFAHLDRTIRQEKYEHQQRAVTKYMLAIIALLVALLVARFIINAKLREAGRALSAQLATREAILGSVDAAILGLGAQGEVLYSNRNARALLGPAAGNGARFLPGAGAQGSLTAELSAMLASRQGLHAGETHDMRKVRVGDGPETRHYVIRTSSAEPAMKGRDARTDASLIVVVTDVTTEEEAALRREEYDARLGEASRILAYAAMSGGIVHEISQPLAAMRNYVYTLKASMNLGKAGEEHHLIVDQLGVEIDRAIEVVRNIRQMGPQGPQDIGMCDVHEAIAQSIRLVSLGASPPPPIAVTPGKDPVVIAGSLPMVGQVVVNLLKNALSASSAAGRAGAKVDIRLLDDSAEIAVADFGDGVSDDTAKTMFAPFSKSARGGMGLGLAICQRIATNLGGSLSWENDRSAGAVFKFRVPLARQGALH